MTEEPTPDSNARLVERHRERAAALLAGDLETLTAVMDPRLLFVHVNGRAESGADLIAALREKRLRYDALVFKDSRIVVQGSIGIVQGEMHAEVFTRGEQRTLQTRFASTWIEEGQAGWRLLAYTATLI